MKIGENGAASKKRHGAVKTIMALIVANSMKNAASAGGAAR